MVDAPPEWIFRLRTRYSASSTPRKVYTAFRSFRGWNDRSSRYPRNTCSAGNTDSQRSRLAAYAVWAATRGCSSAPRYHWSLTSASPTRPVMCTADQARSIGLRSM